MSIGRKILSFGALLVLFGAVSVSVSAQDIETKTDEKPRFEKKGKFGKKGGRGFRGKRRGGILRGLSRLDLSETQKSQIKTLVETERNANQGIREEMKTLIMKRRDGSDTEADRERMGELREQFRTSRTQLQASILNLLTDEQKQQLEQMKQQRRERMERRRQLWQERKQQRDSEAPTNKDN